MGVVEVVRGDLVEARHSLRIVVADHEGAVVASIGDVDELTYYRSAAKPLQALPLVEEGVVDRFGLSDAELALCCGSHEGETEHVAGARSILRKAGLEESLLRCGPHLPFSPEATRALLAGGGQAACVHNNCSGKHAGMLALAAALAWDPVDYHLPEHPVQLRMLDEIRRWTELSSEEIRTGVDGCGVMCFAVPLRDMAASFARFAAAAARDEGAKRVVNAMTAHPFMVGGTGRTCTDVMKRAAGRAFVKVGAEGVYAGGVTERGLGFAIKVVDGGRRAVEVALVRVLSELGVLSSDDVDALRQHANPTLYNTRGEEVGEIRAAFDLAGAIA
ncbi:MAG: asparaginase [Gemmatimonadetes bacterium]|nr:asparaginase [Gemmatimonadota bacterium]